MPILLVEDDFSLAGWIIDYLQQHQYQVHHVESAEQALQLLGQQPFELLLLDVRLPGMDGFSLCRIIRKTLDTPIIMLTAQGEEVDEVLGLEIGADDYMVKPVRPRALLARMKSLLSKSDNDKDTPQSLCFGRLSLNQKAQRALLGDEELGLSSGEFSLLWFLAANAGRVIGREEAFKTLKGRDYDGMDRWFDVMISTLRKKVQEDPHAPQRIKTAWGKGYLFVADAWN